MSKPVKAVAVFYHDDPPCEEKLDADGKCPECRFVPDMQSLAIRYHCPICKVPLENMECCICRQTYERPH